MSMQQKCKWHFAKDKFSVELENIDKHTSLKSKWFYFLKIFVKEKNFEHKTATTKWPNYDFVAFT